MQMTTVYFPETVHMRLKQLARQRGEPMSELVRVFVEEGLSKTKKPNQSFAARLAGYKLKMGRKLSARDIDKLVYRI